MKNRLFVLICMLSVTVGILGVAGSLPVEGVDTSHGQPVPTQEGCSK